MEKMYSIIIPNRNNKELLNRLLSSIPKRKDIEILIVDDNSDELDPEFYPGIERSEVRVIFTTEGKGAGFARNVGLKEAKGRWIVFADSDDFFMEDAFAVLDKYTDSSYDVVYYNISSVDSCTLKKSSRNSNYDKYIKLYLDGKDKEGHHIRFKKWEPWNKMIKNSYLKRTEIQFDEIPRCNDMIFSLLVSYNTNNFHVIKDIIYCVTYNPHSITRKKLTEGTLWCSILCEVKKNYLYEKIGHRFWKSTFCFILLCLLKNNGLIETLSFLRMLYSRRRDLVTEKINFSKRLQKK